MLNMAAHAELSANIPPKQPYPPPEKPCLTSLPLLLCRAPVERNGTVVLLKCCTKATRALCHISDPYLREIKTAVEEDREPVINRKGLRDKSKPFTRIQIQFNDIVDGKKVVC